MKMASVLVLAAIVLVGGCVQPQTQKTCEQAVQELEFLVESSNYCQTDTDCVFSDPSFAAVDGIVYRSDNKYGVNKEQVEEINSKIKNVLETSCKDASSKFWGPVDYSECKNNKCISSKDTAQSTIEGVKCCEQCRYGANHDPRGFDISIAPCLDYKDENRYDSSGSPVDEKVLSQECVDYFEKNPTTVGECRFI